MQSARSRIPTSSSMEEVAAKRPEEVIARSSGIASGGETSSRSGHHLLSRRCAPTAPPSRRSSALVLGALLLTLAACASAPGSTPPLPGEPGPGGTPPPIPLDGPIAYRCSDGTQLVVDVDASSARVAIVGGPSMVLPEASEGYYTNGRYGFRGGGASGQWEVGRAAPVSCSGS